MKCYRNIVTNKVVYEDDAIEYALQELGIIVKPKGENGEMTIEQIENIEETKEWFFSGNWIKEEKENEEIEIARLINEECEIEDRM